MYTITCSDCNGNSCIIFDFFCAQQSVIGHFLLYKYTHITLCTKAKYIGTKHVYTQLGNYKLFSDIATPKTITVSVRQRARQTNVVCMELNRINFKGDVNAPKNWCSCQSAAKLRKLATVGVVAVCPCKIFFFFYAYREIKRIDATKMPKIFEDVYSKIHLI